MKSQSNFTILNPSFLWSFVRWQSNLFHLLEALPPLRLRSSWPPCYFIMIPLFVWWPYNLFYLLEAYHHWDYGHHDPCYFIMEWWGYAPAFL